MVLRTVLGNYRRRWQSARAVHRSVPFGHLRLPPPILRPCTVEFKDDRFFVASARREVDTLIERCGLAPGSRILEIGCGTGRLPLGILSRGLSIRTYEGIDVDRQAIRWCHRWITRAHPAFRFTFLDAYNERYNPAGAIRLDEKFRFNFRDAGFDVISLYSVFTHMEVEDIRVYLREIRRLIAPQGRIFLTAYLESRVPDVSINPPGYGESSGTPLHRVRLDKQYFESLLADQGLEMVRLDHRCEYDGQSGVCLAQVAASATGFDPRRPDQ